MTRRVAVAGGGIAGLATAFRLLEGAKQRGLELEVMVLDAGPGGGSIGTVRRDGYVLEEGPDCFLSTKPAAIKLCEDLGIANRLIGTNPAHRRSFIARGGQLHQIPEGFHLLAPSRFWPFVTTRLFSWPGKLRMGLDLFIPRKQGDEDESLESFVTRRLGREGLERAAQPMVGGIYTADPRTLSVKATFPQFLDMEREHGSLLLAMWRARAAQERARSAVGKASGARYDLFITLDDGVSRLIETLLSKLPPDTLRASSRVTGLSERPGGWTLSLNGGESLEADAVCLAVPAPSALAAVEKLDPEMADAYRGIPYASVATINFGFSRSQVPHSLDGMGFVVPAIENRTIHACSFSSVKFANRAPEGKVLLRAFAGGATHEHTLRLSDEKLVEAALADLQVYLGITTQPELVHVKRYPGAMPQYYVGHLDRVARIESREAAHPGLAVAGNSLRGVGIGDCAASAERAAARILDYLASR